MNPGDPRRRAADPVLGQGVTRALVHKAFPCSVSDTSVTTKRPSRNPSDPIVAASRVEARGRRNGLVSPKHPASELAVRMRILTGTDVPPTRATVFAVRPRRSFVTTNHRSELATVV